MARSLTHAASFTPRWCVPLWLAVGCISLAAAALAARTDPELGALVALAGFVVTFAVPLFAIRRSRPAKLEIDERAISFDGKRRLDAPLTATRIDGRGYIDVRSTVAAAWSKFTA